MGQLIAFPQHRCRYQFSDYRDEAATVLIFPPAKPISYAEVIEEIIDISSKSWLFAVSGWWMGC